MDQTQAKSLWRQIGAWATLNASKQHTDHTNAYLRGQYGGGQSAPPAGSNEFQTVPFGSTINTTTNTTAAPSSGLATAAQAAVTALALAAGGIGIATLAKQAGLFGQPATPPAASAPAAPAPAGQSSLNIPAAIQQAEQIIEGQLNWEFTPNGPNAGLTLGPSGPVASPNSAQGAGTQPATSN